jgi:hypothetical protein
LAMLALLLRPGLTKSERGHKIVKTKNSYAHGTLI